MKLLYSASAMPPSNENFVVASFRRIARKAGGLHVGVRVRFPASTWVPGLVCNRVYRTSNVTLGLLFWEWSLELWRFDHHEHTPIQLSHL